MIIYSVSYIAIFGLLFTLVFASPVNQTGVGEYGNHFQGDMILTKEQLKAVTTEPESRNAIIDVHFRWPKGIVPYELSPEHTPDQQEYIEYALRILESMSCVRFKRRSHESDYVQLRGQNGGCHSQVGHVGGRQILNLAPHIPGEGCFRLGSIMHEFLHTLGLFHMQSAYDRDQYVVVIKDNIVDGMEHNFDKYSSNVVTHFNNQYDYESIMHYDTHAFSKNGQPTLIPIDQNYMRVIGQRGGLSAIDIKKINDMYECDSMQPQPPQHPLPPQPPHPQRPTQPQRPQKPQRPQRPQKQKPNKVVFPGDKKKPHKVTFPDDDSPGRFINEDVSNDENEDLSNDENDDYSNDENDDLPNDDVSNEDISVSTEPSSS